MANGETCLWFCGGDVHGLLMSFQRIILQAREYFVNGETCG